MATQEAVIQTDASLAAELASTSDDAVARRIKQLVSEAGGELAPTFPGAAGDLASYFHCFVEPAEFERVSDELRAQPGVRAAYLKPEGRAPLI